MLNKNEIICFEKLDRNDVFSIIMTIIHTLKQVTWHYISFHVQPFLFIRKKSVMNTHLQIMPFETVPEVMNFLFMVVGQFY